MTILLTGGTGKTSTRVAQKLLALGFPVLLTSRKGQSGVPAPFKGVTFDWNDASTYSAPFDADASIDRVYLIAPPLRLDAGQLVKNFIDVAKERGVKRFVALSAAAIPKGGPGHGKTHEYLADLGVDYCILRPSWFQENFLDRTMFPTIWAKDAIITATGDGKLGFVSIDDIADVAVSALTDEKSHNTDHIIVGPELLSYSETAHILSDAIGRPIVHKNVSVEARKRHRIAMGMNETFATIMGAVEAGIAGGNEERIYATENKIVGKRYFKDFVKENKSVWQTK